MVRSIVTAERSKTSEPPAKATSTSNVATIVNALGLAVPIWSERLFRQRAVSPTGGEGNFAQGNYKGHLSNDGETLELEDADGRVVDNMTYLGD